MLELADCFFETGSDCDLVKNSVAAANKRSIDETGYSLYAAKLGTPPNYYTGVYDAYNSQPYVVVNNKVKGGTVDVEAFENDENSFIAIQASELEITIKEVRPL